MSIVKDRTGKRYGRLVVMRFSHVVKAGEGKGKGAYWVCRCDCGAIATVRGMALNCGDTISCGCRRREVAEERKVTKRVHGCKNRSWYDTWRKVVRRCNNKRDSNYARYGGRGIAVCDRWLDPVKFGEDMGEKPEGMTIDRINNDGDYEPGNCRWATPKTQGRNRRDNRLVEIGSDLIPVSEFADRFGMPDYLARQRLCRGWSVLRVINEPLGGGPYKGEDPVGVLWRHSA